VSAICESQRYFSDNKHDDNNNNGDALKVFFEKRRAALQKEKQQNRNQTQQRWSKQNQRNEKQVQEQNVESFIRENTDATKEKDSLSSFFEKRRAVHNNNNMNKQKRGKRQSDSNKNRKWVKGNKATDNWSNSFQNQNKPNNGRRGQQHNSNQQNQNNNNDSSRLADLMKQLRRDAPPVKQNSQTREPFWRQGVYQNNKSKEEQRWSRASFLNKPKTNSQNRNNMRRNPQRNNRYQYQQKEGSEFLEGRLTRKQDSVPSSSPGEPQDLIVTIPNNSLTLTDISSLFRVKVDAIQRKLRNMGEYPSKNEEGEPILDVDLMELLALEYGIETVRSTIGTEIVCTSELLLKQRRRDDEESSLPPRPPVVCIMGHVDHGKTTLMDALRRRSLEQLTSTGKAKKEKSKKKGKKSQTKPQDVAGTEAGGITQIISAFQVALEGQRITFLDTPGHAAFKSMRQSGSHAADVIVLVIAADDGISPQTLEILNFYKQICEGSGDGNISLVVALNKIDKPGIVVEEAQRNIENQLLEQGIIPEGMNGDSQFGSPVQVIPTSGLTGQGLDDLMEGLLLQSEVMDLRADDKESAEGIIMDTAVEKGLGVVATAIIRFGTIRKGDVVVSGDQIGRVKILKDGMYSL
jgi:translation initiation factor IF-2